MTVDPGVTGWTDCRKSHPRVMDDEGRWVVARPIRWRGIGRRKRERRCLHDLHLDGAGWFCVTCGKPFRGDR